MSAVNKINCRECGHAYDDCACIKYWFRGNPREDHQRQPLFQRFAGCALEARALPTSMPLVRMDIQTAVQIATLSDYPLGIVELLTQSEPVALDKLDGPLLSSSHERISGMVTQASAALSTGRRWANNLARQARVARQTLTIDTAARERRRVNQLAYNKDTRYLKLATWACLMAGSLFTLALVKLVVLILRGH